MPDRSGRLATIRAALTPAEWNRVGAMTAVVIGLHVLGWGLLAAAVARGHHYVSRGPAFGVGTGVLAYTLGMRHAFDADHIAAIDNTTRKLVGEGKRPLSVGFFFSLGHSSVVFILAVLLNFGIRALNSQVHNNGSALHGVTSLVGTSVSGTFLYLIAALNAVILVGIVKVFREMRSGRFSNAELEEQLAKRGLMNRLLGPLNKRVDAPWKMYPIGLLFGLGFDTATEVAFLVLAGTAVISGLPFYAVLSLPFLFAAGMSLFDTADGCFMNFAYDWAFARPVRKVYYNLTITGLSVFVAFFIGTIEILGLVGQQAHLAGGFWAFMAGFNLNKAGLVIAGVFVLTWVVALAIWRFGQIEEKWDAAMIRGAVLDDGTDLADSAVAADGAGSEESSHTAAGLP
ncbi:MAG TPA: HoxN/HupN/NixA family nickel/cobalt transporter [Streptosporangiaceae bacterium]|nr:HoxN/HupN/NixA family nickel/cobalt transporter [Streptosporangiaceae bacterium]